MGLLTYFVGGGAAAMCLVPTDLTAPETEVVRWAGLRGVTGVLIEESVEVRRRDPFPVTESSSSSPSLPFFFFLDFLASALRFTPVQSWGAFI